LDGSEENAGVEGEEDGGQEIVSSINVTSDSKQRIEDN